MVNDEFTRGDELAQAGDKVALEYGWWGEQWILAEAQKSHADPNSRAALSYALDILEKHHGRWLSPAQIADRIRIGRAFPKFTYDEIVAELHYSPSFSQLRAAYVRDDQKLTMELLLWAAENDATPVQINARKMGCDVEDEEQKAWRHFTEWADKYVCRAGDRNKGRYRLAREVIEADRLERISPKS